MGCCREGPPHFRKCGRIQAAPLVFPADGIAPFCRYDASLSDLEIAGSSVPTDVKTAPAPVEVAALNRTLHVIVGLVVIALLLSLWAL